MPKCLHAAKFARLDILRSLAALGLNGPSVRRERLELLAWLSANRPGEAKHV